MISTPKAHNKRGRVEQKISVLRCMLDKLGHVVMTPRTTLQWETIFSQISNSLDDLPLAKGNTSSGSFLGYETITPNRLKLGRNNGRSLHGDGFFLTNDYIAMLDSTGGLKLVKPIVAIITRLTNS